MRTFVVLAVSTVLVSILFCTMVIAAPSLPDDVRMVQPNPSLPKELSAFWGKWQGVKGNMELFVIVERIGDQNAGIYLWRSGDPRRGSPGWRRVKAEVIKESGKYKLRFRGGEGTVEFTLIGDELEWYTAPSFSALLTRVP